MIGTQVCRYCGADLPNAASTSCEWCNAIIQEANCHGVYLVDAAVAVSKREDLTTPATRRAEIQAKFDLYTGK